MSNATRWDTWVGHARRCCKAATAIDKSASTVRETLSALGAAQEMAQAIASLHEAQAALEQAKEAVKAALATQRLTPQNREVVYGLAA
jgi:hypothetical protein